MKLTFENYLNESHSYACVMADIKNEKILNVVSELQSKINRFTVSSQDGDSVKNGLETNTHITIFYGLDDNVINSPNFKNIIKKYKDHVLDLTVKEVSYFESDDYRVCKLGCESKTLSLIHNDIRDTLPHHNTFPDYKPHITIAYLKKDAQNIEHNIEFPIELELESYYICLTNDLKIKL